MTFKEACMKTFANCPDGYAKTYAKAGIWMTDKQMVSDQCLYILGNIAHWRGPLAKECREVFKRHLIKG